MKQAIAHIITLGLAVTLAACAPVSPVQQQTDSPAATSMTPVKACVNWSPNILPHAYAQEHGLFAQYGLEVSLITLNTGTNATMALIAGDADICELAGPAVVNAALAGEDLVFVAGTINQQTSNMVVRPEIAGSDDLRGTTMAVSSAGGSSDYLLRGMLKSMGLTPDQDVTIVAAGDNPERLAAMESGQVVGTVLGVLETARAEDLGYRVLVAADQPDYPTTTVVTRRDFLADNRPVVVAYMQAITEAIARVKTDREGAQAVMVDLLGLDPVADASLLDRVYDRLVGVYLVEKPYPTQAGVQAVIDASRLENPAAPDLTAADMIDGSIVEELDRSGFIDGLYQQ